MTIKTYQIIGRMKPSEKDPEPKVYRMKLFARDDVCARSKFWYFIRCARRGTPPVAVGAASCAWSRNSFRRASSRPLGSRRGATGACWLCSGFKGACAHVAPSGRRCRRWPARTSVRYLHVASAMQWGQLVYHMRWARSSARREGSPLSRWLTCRCESAPWRRVPCPSLSLPMCSKLRRVKKANGQILTCHELIEKNTRTVKNYGVWLRYESRTGTHNMYAPAPARPTALERVTAAPPELG